MTRVIHSIMLLVLALSTTYFPPYFNYDFMIYANTVTPIPLRNGSCFIYTSPDRLQDWERQLPCNVTGSERAIPNRYYSIFAWNVAAFDDLRMRRNFTVRPVSAPSLQNCGLRSLCSDLPCFSRRTLSGAIVLQTASCASPIRSHEFVVSLSPSIILVC
jgi:hypothetical protein